MVKWLLILGKSTMVKKKYPKRIGLYRYQLDFIKLYLFKQKLTFKVKKQESVSQGWMNFLELFFIL